MRIITRAAAFGYKLTGKFEDCLIVLVGRVDNLNLTSLTQLEADVVVVAIVNQTVNLLRQFIVTLHVVLTFPCAVQRYFQHVILISLQVKFKRVNLGLDCIGFPSLRFLQTGINYQRTIACDVELGRYNRSRHICLSVPFAFVFTFAVRLCRVEIWLGLCPCQVNSLL